MPHTDAKPTYRVEFTADEFRLVTLGLAGLIRELKDQENARKLNVQLCSQRATFLKMHTDKAVADYEHAKALYGREEKNDS